MSKYLPRIHSSLAFLLLIFFCGCSVQNRVYRKGYYVHWQNHSLNQDKKTSAARETKSRQEVPRRLTKAVHVIKPVVEATCDEPIHKSYIQNKRQADRAWPDLCKAITNEDLLISNGATLQGSPHSYPELQSVSGSHVLVAAPGNKRKADLVGLIAFALSIGAWFTTGYFTLPLFVLAAVLALISLRTISNAPERYVLKTLSLIALILALVGTALSLYTLVLLIFS